MIFFIQLWSLERLRIGRPYFGQPTAPPVPHHLQDDGDAIDGDVVEGIQQGLLTEPEVQAQPAKRELANPLGFRWRVPLSWVHNPSGLLALY